jgi:hypothetical protein
MTRPRMNAGSAACELARVPSQLRRKRQATRIRDGRPDGGSQALTLVERSLYAVRAKGSVVGKRRIVDQEEPK